MTIGHKAGHYCHFRVLRSAYSDTGRKKKKQKQKFWDLLGGRRHLRLEGAKGGDRIASEGSSLQYPSDNRTSESHSNPT